MTTPDEPLRPGDPPPAGLRRVPRFGAGATGLVSLLLVTGLLLVPLLGLLVAPLGLIPVLHFQAAGTPGVRAWGWVVAALVAASLLGAGPFPVALLAAYILLVALPSLSLEAWTRLGWSEGRWAAVTATAAIAAVLLVMAVATRPVGGPVEGVAGWMREAAVGAKEMYGALGIAESEIELAYDASERVVPWVLPSAVAVYFVAVLFWVRPRLPLLGFRLPVTPFEAYRGDDWLAAGFAVAGLGTLLLEGTPRWAALNLLITVLVLYFVQGLAMIRAHLARWVGRGWFVRWGIALLCIYPPMPILVTTLGVADSFFPLRPAAGDDGGNP